MDAEYKYPGDELIWFLIAKNWKRYFARQIKPYIKGMVLEVGAGIGSNTRYLNDGTAPAWLMLEPDKNMAGVLERDVLDKRYPSNCRIKKGTIDDVELKFDTIIYIDVLEHIEADAQELQKASSVLNPEGHIIVLAPAFQHLFNPFDKAIGHYRRYNRKTLKSIQPHELKCISSRYYDSMGYFASLANKVFLKQKNPSQHQVQFWDKWMVPASRVTDKIFFHCFGKSIIAIWKKKSN